MLILRAILQLVRIDSSLLGFLAIFIPSFARTGNATVSFKRALPLLFICACAFVANDLDDIEKDRVNHPNRPLPKGRIPITFAVIVYFTCLGFALFSTKYYVEESISFWYYGLVALSISYGYVVESFPSLKPIYVATVAAIPILIIAVWYPEEPKLYVVSISLFLQFLGREICMDIKDRQGDNISFFHGINPSRLAATAFSLQITGILLLVSKVTSFTAIICLLLMVCLLGLSCFNWFWGSRYRLAISLMKTQLFVGLYFLT